MLRSNKQEGNMFTLHIEALEMLMRMRGYERTDSSVVTTLYGEIEIYRIAPQTRSSAYDFSSK